MKAVVMRQGRLTCEAVDRPVPGPGQVLVRTLACGICGTDLHALHHLPGFLDDMVLTDKLLFAVPEGLSNEHAALTEPMSVGAHAVARAAISGPVVVVVVGCGPIGLAVIAALRADGIGPVIGLDYSPGRRRFAEALGADEVVDPAREPIEAVWSRHHAGSRSRRAVVFECVGRPGVAQSLVATAPRCALLVVVGNALEACTLDQVMAFNKELDIRFSMNFTAAEFQRTLRQIAEGDVDVGPILTGVVEPEQAMAAFDGLRDPERHAKMVISFKAQDPTPEHPHDYRHSEDAP